MQLVKHAENIMKSGAIYLGVIELEIYFQSSFCSQHLYKHKHLEKSGLCGTAPTRRHDACLAASGGYSDTLI